MIAHTGCAIDIVIDGPPVQARWYDIWGAANAIVAVCARQGRDGVSAAISMGFCVGFLEFG